VASLALFRRIAPARLKATVLRSPMGIFPLFPAWRGGAFRDRSTSNFSSHGGMSAMGVPLFFHP
jgi:hypothetical protein